MRRKDRGTGKLFENPVLEKLTRTHIAIPLTLFPSIASCVIGLGINKGYVTSGQSITLFFSGLLTFTFVEYLIHRYIFHISGTSSRINKFRYVIHGIHHNYPKDKKRLAMPPLLSLILVFGFFCLFHFLMGDLTYGFFPGFITGYALYLWVHYMVHAYTIPDNYFKILWTHHNLHHYKCPEKAFGVSTPLWDFIFGTMPKKSK